MYAFDFPVFLLILYGTISKKKRPFPQSVTFFAQVGFEAFADAEYPLLRCSGYSLSVIGFRWECMPSLQGWTGMRDA